MSGSEFLETKHHTMNINELTIGQVRELTALLGQKSNSADDSHWEIGEAYLIRTVTMIDTGILVKVTDKELVIKDAAWIADTGNFSHAVAAAEFNAVEPFPAGRVIINRSSVIDAVVIKKAPRDQK